MTAESGSSTPTFDPGPATDPLHRALVVRSADGADERHLLDVTEMTSDAGRIAGAAEAARTFTRLAVDGGEIPVFDLRAPGAGSAPVLGGCLVIGRRGMLRVALLVD
jgi:hypothetical protein